MAVCLSLEVSYRITEYCNAGTFGGHGDAVADVALFEIRPMRELGESHRALGVRHEAEHAAVVARDTCDVLEGAVGIGGKCKVFCGRAFGVAQGNGAAFVECRERLCAGNVLTFAVCYRERE